MRRVRLGCGTGGRYSGLNERQTMTRDVVAYSQDIYQERRMSNGVETSVCGPGGASLCEADEVTFWRGGHVGVVEAKREVRGGVRVRNIGLTDGLSGSDRVCYKGRPGPVERPSEVTCRLWAGGQGAAGRGGGGESARQRWRYQSSGCVMGTCIHDMRGGMGSGGDVHATGGAPEWGG